jgi:predicted MPP superfamily phosphohydrolase
MTRRDFLSLGALGVAALGTDAFAIEPNRVEVTRHRLGRPDGSQPLRIAQLSDLHLRAVGFHERRVAARVTELATDLVLLTGDSIDRADKLRELDEFLALLPASISKYAILGNWERWARVGLDRLAAVYAGHGCRLLVNESAEIQHGERRLLITGLDDLLGGRPDLTHALRGMSPTANHLLLEHCPGYRGDPVLNSADRTSAGFHMQYMLSGHTHGGQIAPLGWAPHTPRGSGRYVSGWYAQESPQLYVSRGIGTTVIPARIGSVPEIAFFEWYLR